MVDESSTPTAEEIKTCVDAGYYNPSVDNGRTDNWYCLLRNLQGDFKELVKLKNQCKTIYMIEYADFIHDSLFCEYGYIINLDTGNFEFWKGSQKKPQKGNRYGEIKTYGSYYPCRLALEIPLTEMEGKNADQIVNEMLNILEVA